jgi:hypothetical protein
MAMMVAIFYVYTLVVVGHATIFIHFTNSFWLSIFRFSTSWTSAAFGVLSQFKNSMPCSAVTVFTLCRRTVTPSWLCVVALSHSGISKEFSLRCGILWQAQIR